MSTQHQFALHDMHSMVTNQFIEVLEKGIIPWHVSWNEHPQGINGYPFDHLNVWLLAHLPYSRKVFLNSTQMYRFKVTKKRGERGHMSLGMRRGTIKSRFYYSKVYNIEQLDGIYDEIVPSRNIIRSPMERCAKIVAEMTKLPCIVWDASSVYYSLKEDIIFLQEEELFDNAIQYYSSLFYVLAQCTGHSKRRNRDTATHRHQTHPKTYSCEELITEMTASYLCSCAGITPWYLTKHHADSKGWLRKLQMDTTLVITAAMYAQEAVNYILNRSPLANPIQTGLYTPMSE